MTLGTGPAVPALFFCHREEPFYGRRRGDLSKDRRGHQAEIATPSARNDTGDITQYYTINVPPIYLNEFMNVVF
ncbi:MAG: hypothetical protein MUO97_00495 [Dehalococcoidia bacterium]|nr:hypothetical protein [Dehalococcoidia bacterium]